MNRFKIHEGEKYPSCLLCSQLIFRQDINHGFFCLKCKPRVYICSLCRDIFLESHNVDHLIGMYFKDEETYLDHYKMEIQETCERLIFEEKFRECVRFCQNALNLNLSREIAIYSLKMGMLCHVNLLEYSEAKVCGKSALKIIEYSKIENNEDEIEIISRMCHIYLKLEKTKKCLALGTDILDRIESGKLKQNEISEEMHFEIMYCCGKAYKEVGKYGKSLRLLEKVLLRACQIKKFINGRFALSSILDNYLLLNQRDNGLNKLDEYKKFYPLLFQKENDVDVSYIRLKKSMNKLRDIPAVDTLDLSNSMDGKLIAFNKQHYLAIIDNDVNSSFTKLVYSVEIAEELIIQLLKEREKLENPEEEDDGEEEDDEIDSEKEEKISAEVQIASIDQKLENVIKKRSQLIERIYCCCLLRKKPLEAFQWAERGISYLCFARNLITKNDLLEEEEKSKLLEEKLNMDELMELARQNDIIFIFFVVVNELHFSIGDFVDVWVIRPKPRSLGEMNRNIRKNYFKERELVRIQLIHKPLEIVRMILEMYTEVNQINSFFLNRIRKQRFKDHVDEIKRWQTFVDKLFSSNQRKFKRYNELLEELYTYLIIPIQAYLPRGEIHTMLRSKNSTHDIPQKQQKTRNSKAAKITRKSNNNNNKENFEYKKRLKEKPKNLVIIPDDFVSFIPFSFLKKSKSEFLVDYFNVSISHSLKMFYYNIWQLRNGRKMRKMIIQEKIQEKLNPIPLDDSPTMSPKNPLKSKRNSYDSPVPNSQKANSNSLDIPVENSPLFVNTQQSNEIPSPLRSPVSQKAEKKNSSSEKPLSLRNRNELLGRVGKEAMFGFIMTDSYDEFRKTEILPIHQLFQSTIRRNEMSSYCDSLMFPPSDNMKKSLRRFFKEFYEPFLGPKIVHIANRSSCSGKNLPTFQKEMSPKYGLQLMFSDGNSSKADISENSSDVLMCDELEDIFDFHGTELVVFSHNASIYTNSTYDGLNGIHRSISNLGCPSILYPLFDVSEFFSTLFLVQFYKHLFGTDNQTKKSKAEAYRNAMISSMEIFPMLRQAPMFLSSFQLMGESMNHFKDDDDIEAELLKTLKHLDEFGKLEN